ncbi:MAG TPA: efflux transporter outer membrane subunit [Flavipsychrobacter sp.]|nr:efflux transporter outer membrane subunit [Flavipsychrobacter sp.]
MFAINKLIYITLAIATLSISSCGIRQVYHRPDVPLPQQFGQSNITDTNSVANLKWNEFFTDTTLQQLIRKGLEHNYDLQIALKNIDIAREQVKQAKTLELPELSAQVGVQIDRPSDNSLNGATAQGFLHQAYLNDYNANLTLSWEADVWGKIHMQKQATVARYLQTYEATQAVRTRLISDIAQGYYNLLMLDEQLNIAQYNLKLSDTTLLLARLQKEAGNATQLGVEQAEAQRQATAILIPSLQQAIALQENALSILTGDLPGSITRSTLLSEATIPDNLSAGVPVSMVSRRPDVHAMEMALVAASKDVGVARASMYPSLVITAQGGLDAFKTSNWFNIPGSLFGIVTGSVAQPLLEHRTLKTRYKVAEDQREQTVLQFRQSVLNAVGEVDNALVREEKLKEQQQISEERVDTLRKSIVNAQLLFRSDMATYLEVITAQGNALQAELDLANIQKSKLDASIDLYRALGGGRN